MSMIERQQFKCALSGLPLEPETASLDHIVPIARGGEHCIENIWIVHQQVNAAKGSMTTDEFITLCRAVSAAHKQRQSNDIQA